MTTNVKENGFNIFSIVPDVYSFNEYLFKYLKIQFKKHNQAAKPITFHKLKRNFVSNIVRRIQINLEYG